MKRVRRVDTRQAKRPPERRLHPHWLVAALGLAALAACRPPQSSAPEPPPQLPPVAKSELRPLLAFAELGRPQRSAALFAEAARVMRHPRCSNCHPSGSSPSQGLLAEYHDPPVMRGPDSRGVVGMRCEGCHQATNLELSRVPGAQDWHLAPLSMAWQGRSLEEICQNLKNPKSNGDRTLAEVVDHTAHDALVAWGWAPGNGREPAPGSQAEFTALMQAWVDSGAQCPTWEPEAL